MILFPFFLITVIYNYIIFSTSTFFLHSHYIINFIFILCFFFQLFLVKLNFTLDYKTVALNNFVCCLFIICLTQPGMVGWLVVDFNFLYILSIFIWSNYNDETWWRRIWSCLIVYDVVVYIYDVAVVDMVKIVVM